MNHQEKLTEFEDFIVNNADDADAINYILEELRSYWRENIYNLTVENKGYLQYLLNEANLTKEELKNEI